MTNSPRLIESDAFPFEFLSQIGERESWRKEVHRPIYHVHKWWAKRLGSVFRGILLGAVFDDQEDLQKAFYRVHDFANRIVFDPFMGSGTTIGEAHKIGCTSIGRDINPVAVAAVRAAMGPLDRSAIHQAYESLSAGVGAEIRSLYNTRDSRGRNATVLYYFWVMQANCPSCQVVIDLFSSWTIARNANPARNPETQILCPSCGMIFPGLRSDTSTQCPQCHHEFAPQTGTTNGAVAGCLCCRAEFKILDAVNGKRPSFRLYAKLVLRADGGKEYLPATTEDHAEYDECSRRLTEELRAGSIQVPKLALEHGYNTKQAMRYGFKSWRDFFNDRQLLTLGLLHAAIAKIDDSCTRNALATLFSGVLEFNNLFASYKGEGTGAVRHMFSHHILKPERTPIEANVWGTPKSSGSFSNLFRSRLMRALDYRDTPTEVNGLSGSSILCSRPFSGLIDEEVPDKLPLRSRGIYLSCGDSSRTDLAARSVDLVVTDPPFFDNVHYSELADFFHAWQQLQSDGANETTRSKFEVQDTDSEHFATKLQAVFVECNRVLKEDGLLVFSYHHSREDGWHALAAAVLNAGFVVVNSQPVKAEMSVATPKSQAKEPIQLDIVLVCRKACDSPRVDTVADALRSANAKLARLFSAGFALSRNDCKIALIGQLLTTFRSTNELDSLVAIVESELAALDVERLTPSRNLRDCQTQQTMF